MAPTHQDMCEWVRAMRLHQIDLFRSRSSIFEQWLVKQGVKVPGGVSKQVTSSQFIEDTIADKEVNEVLMNDVPDSNNLSTAVAEVEESAKQEELAAPTGESTAAEAEQAHGGSE